MSSIISESQDITNQIGSIIEVSPVIKSFSSTLYPKKVVTKITQGDTSSAMIWGRDNWGSNWGGTITETLYAVLPNNNIFVEYFGQDDYIDTSVSTGTLDTVNETYTLSAGQVLQTEIIYKPRGPIRSVKIQEHVDFVDTGTGMTIPFTLGVDQFGSDNMVIEVSNDGGVTFYPANEGEKYTFSTTTSDDELVVKFTSGGSLTISEPIFIEVNK